MNKLFATMILAAACLVAACTASQIQQTETALSSPAGQALIAGVENFTPGIQKVVAKINAGLAATADDKAMVCGALSWANTLFATAAPIAKISTADQATEAAGMVGVNAVCSSTSTTNLDSDVAALLSAFGATKAALQGAGVSPAS